MLTQIILHENVLYVLRALPDNTPASCICVHMCMHWMLLQLLVDSGLVRALHRVYVRAHTGDEKLDPLRKLVLELLTAKDSFKK